MQRYFRVGSAKFGEIHTSRIIINVSPRNCSPIENLENLNCKCTRRFKLCWHFPN